MNTLKSEKADVHMGDDLNDARDFMSICQNRVARLLGGSAISSASAIAALGDIHTQALKMKARGIARLAQYAIDDLNHSSSAETCAQSVHAMTRLIRQYGRGLDEILAGQSTGKSASLAELPRIPTLPGERDEKPTAAQKAADNLTDLMHLAKPQEAQPLGQLIAFARAGAPEKPKAATPPIPTSRFSFDTIMPDITSEILRMARQQNKSISVSFAADELPMDADILTRLERCLMSLSSKLVSRTVETPQARESRNLSKSAHIAFTAQDNGGRLDVYISTDGHSPGDITEDDYVSDIIKLGARANLTVDGMSVRLKILGIPDTEPRDQTGAIDPLSHNLKDEKIAS